MKSKKNRILLVVCIAIPLAVGVLAGFFSGGGMKEFEMLNKPPLSPPGWLFPVVWIILYVLMGIASWLVIRSGGERDDLSRAIALYGYQLTANFLWPVFFFAFGWYLFSFFWLILLWFLILFTIRSFCRVSRTAAVLLIPYLVWVTFAGYLNFGIWLLN